LNTVFLLAHSLARERERERERESRSERRERERERETEREASRRVDKRSRRLDCLKRIVVVVRLHETREVHVSGRELADSLRKEGCGVDSGRDADKDECNKAHDGKAANGSFLGLGRVVIRFHMVTYYHTDYFLSNPAPLPEKSHL
jgi:hypothetical protein